MNDYIVFTNGFFDIPDIKKYSDVEETFHNLNCVRIKTDSPFYIKSNEHVFDVDINREARLLTELDHVSDDTDQLADFEDIEEIHHFDRNLYDGQGEDVSVVVMDSGIDINHPGFNDKFIKQVDVTDSGKGDSVGHGTACAGLIHQIAPKSNIISLRIFGDSNSTKTHYILRAYNWLLNNTEKYDLVNMSWGSSGSVGQINNIHNKLVKKGIRDVVASGNTGKRGGSPATASRAMSVGSVDEEGNLSRYSSYNPNRSNPEVVAVGENVKLFRASGTCMGKKLDQHHVKASGTSFSAPVVTGFLSLMYQSIQDSAGKKTKLLKTRIKERSFNLKGTERDGYGMVDYKKTMNSLLP